MIFSRSVRLRVSWRVI